MKEVLYFSANWCVPCKQMKPIVKQVEEATGVSFRLLDADTESELSFTHKVRAVPTFVYLEDGVEISRATGAQTANELTSALSL